jgi:hypothetical protein
MHGTMNLKFINNFVRNSNHSKPPQDFESEWPSIVRRVHARNDSGGGYFEYLLWIVTW